MPTLWSEGEGNIVKRWASMILPEPEGPIISALCDSTVATSMPRYAYLWVNYGFVRWCDPGLSLSLERESPPWLEIGFSAENELLRE
jgi:hypothetical protein